MVFLLFQLEVHFELKVTLNAVILQVSVQLQKRSGYFQKIFLTVYI